jgi:hypothetical protein
MTAFSKRYTKLQNFSLLEAILSGKRMCCGRRKSVVCKVILCGVTKVVETR